MVHMAKKRMTAAQRRARTTNALKTGENSVSFQRWLKANNIELPEISQEEIDNLPIPEQMKIKWAVHDIRRKKLEQMTSYYRSMGHRGAELNTTLLDLDVKLAERESALKMEGKDPLEDDAWMRANKLKVEIMKQLEKMKYDKDKFMTEQKLKEIHADNDGHLWVVEAEYEEKD